MAKIPTKQKELLELQSQLHTKLPASHYRFLAATKLFYSLGSYFFVHAGVNPNYSLSNQRPEDMLWIRDEFIEAKEPFEKIIVHGHTVTATAELLANRIGIDTGAYASGILTCLVLQGDQQRLIQTQPKKR
jgi:serine/threonine protein phosphatase 1